jgi:hypothetical protein
LLLLLLLLLGLASPLPLLLLLLLAPLAGTWACLPAVCSTSACRRCDNGEGGSSRKWCQQRGDEVSDCVEHATLLLKPQEYKEMVCMQAQTCTLRHQLPANIPVAHKK